MKILATALMLSALCATGCASLQQTPDADETHRIKVKDNAEPIDLIQVQNQLSKFVEIVELLNQTKSAGSEGNIVTESAAKKSTATAITARPKLDELVTAINDNLEQLDDAKDEAKAIRQMLSIADQFSGNKQNLFSGLFDIIIKGAAPAR